MMDASLIRVLPMLEWLLPVRLSKGALYQQTISIQVGPPWPEDLSRRLVYVQLSSCRLPMPSAVQDRAGSFQSNRDYDTRPGSPHDRTWRVLCGSPPIRIPNGVPFALAQRRVEIP